jgi:RluA family pseudouridine synthase
VVLLAFPEGDLHFDPLALEIKTQRNQSHTLGGHEMGQLDDLGMLEQKLAWALFRVIPDISVGPWTDVDFPEPCLVVRVQIHPAVGEIHLAAANGLDLCPAQNDTGFPLVADLVLVESLAVADNGLDSRFFQTKIPPAFQDCLELGRSSTMIFRVFVAGSVDITRKKDPTGRARPGRSHGGGPAQGEWRSLGGPVPDDSHGERVDAYMARFFPFFSRAQWQARIESGELQVNGATVKPSTRLAGGSRVALWYPQLKEPEVSRDVRVLFEEGGIMAVFKPGNLPMHENGPYRHNTFARILADEMGPEWAAVHRLDRETSGIVICAASLKLRSKLTEIWTNQEVEKHYLAIVRGSPELSHWTVDGPIGDLAESQIRIKKWVVPNGLPARTLFEVEGEAVGASLLRAKPRTGRTNQIRIHAAWSGHTLIGDKLFHPDEQVFLDYVEHGNTLDVQQRTGFVRHCLHAAAVRFRHPETGRDFSVDSSLPPDLQDFWISLSGRSP